MVGAVCVVLGATAFAQLPPQRPAPMPALPLTQLDDRVLARDLDNRAFTLTFAQPVPIRDLLLLLVRGTSLSIIPDQGVAGTFIGELKDVTVRQALGLILRPLSLDYALDGSIIRVFRREAETRIFDLNYIATQRVGTSTVLGEGGPRTSAGITSTVKADVFDDLANGVRALLTERATFNVDRKAGLLQVTDFPERLDRVSLYLDAVQDRAHRQVQIDARVIEVVPSDSKATGIDWPGVALKMSGAATADAPATRPTMNGLRVTDVAKLLGLLGEQGTVTTVANPRLLTLNNEPSIVRTDTLTFSVTPQISGDSAVTLSLTPLLKTPAPIESDMLARMMDGETLVISGFTREREVKEPKPAGVVGGTWFGRGTITTHKRVEIVILLTAKIIAGLAAQ